MNKLSSIIFNTIKISLLCGVSFAATEKTLAGKWDSAVEEMKETGILATGKLRNLCDNQKRTLGIEKKNGWMKKLNVWNQRLEKLQEVETNRKSYVDIIKFKAALHDKKPGTYKIKPLTFQDYAPPLGVATTRNLSRPALDEAGRGQLAYKREESFASPGAFRTLTGRSFNNNDFTRVGIIGNGMETGNWFSMPNASEVDSRKDSPSSAPRSNEPDELGERIRELEANIAVFKEAGADDSQLELYNRELNELLAVRDGSVPKTNIPHASTRQPIEMITTMTTTTTQGTQIVDVDAKHKHYIGELEATIASLRAANVPEEEFQNQIDELALLKKASDRDTAFPEVQTTDTIKEDLESKIRELENMNAPDEVLMPLYIQLSTFN